MLNLFRNKRRDCRQAERGAGCAVRWGPGRGRRRPRGSRDCCPPTTLAKLEPVSHLRPPPQESGGHLPEPGPGAALRLGGGEGSSRPPRGPAGGQRGAALPCPALSPPLPTPATSRAAETAAAPRVRSNAGRERGRRQVCLPHGRDRPDRQEPASPAVLSARLCPETPGRETSRRAALGTPRLQCIPRRRPPRPPPRSPSLACDPSGRGGQPETPGHPPTLSCGRGGWEGEEGGGGGEEGRWQDAGDCPGCGAAGVRAPLTAAASGGRAREGGGREGRGEEGGKEGWREGRKEGDPPPGRSAAQRPLKEQKPAFSTAAAPGSPQRQDSPPPPLPARPAGYRRPQGFGGGRRSTSASAAPPPAVPRGNSPELAGRRVFRALEVGAPSSGSPSPFCRHRGSAGGIPAACTNGARRPLPVPVLRRGCGSEPLPQPAGVLEKVRVFSALSRLLPHAEARLSPLLPCTSGDWARALFPHPGWKRVRAEGGGKEPPRRARS